VIWVENAVKLEGVLLAYHDDILSKPTITVTLKITPTFLHRFATFFISEKNNSFVTLQKFSRAKIFQGVFFALLASGHCFELKMAHTLK